MDLGCSNKVTGAGLSPQPRTFPPGLLPPGTQPSALPSSRPDAILAYELNARNEPACPVSLPISTVPALRARVHIVLVEIKVAARDTDPSGQLGRATTQHSNLLSFLLTLGYGSVQCAPLVVGAAGSIYKTTFTTLTSASLLGVSHEAATTCLRKAHTLLCESIPALVGTRAHLAAAHLPPSTAGSRRSTLNHRVPGRARRGAGAAAGG